MSPRALAVLSALVAILAAIVVIDRPRARSGRGDDDERRTRVLADLDASRVERVRLHTPGRADVVLERRGKSLDDFVLSAPIAAPADRAAVGDLLGTLGYLAWRRRVPAADAGARGLDDANARVVDVDLTGGQHLSLRVGRSLPERERAWLSMAGAREHLLVDDYFARALDRGVEDLRRRDPLPTPPDGDVVIEAGAARVELRGLPACVVVEVGGACARADGDRADRLRRRLADVRIARFLDVAPAPGDAPALHVRAAGHELRVFGACPDARDLRLATSELGTGCVRADVADALVAEAADPLAWVDRAVLPLGLRELRRITLARAGVRTVLEREGGAWQRVDAAGKHVPVDDDAIEGWWHDLASYLATEVKRVPAEAAPPAGAATLELAGESGAPLVLWIAPAGAPARVWVRRPGEPVALVVHADVARYFDPDPVQFVSRQVLDFEASALRGLEIDRGGGVVEKAARGATLDEWTLSAPLATPADPDNLAKLRDTAAHLHAVRPVAAAPSPAHGLTPPRRTFTFVLDPPPTTPDAPPTRLSLALGAATADGGCHVRAGDGPVFLVDHDACEALDTPLATRALWPARQATQVAFGRVRYERHGPGWYDAAGTRLGDNDAGMLDNAVNWLGEPVIVLGYGLAPATKRLVITWTDGTTSTLRVGKNEFSVEGRAVRYELMREVCEGIPDLCR